MLDKAILIATKSHQGQIDKAGQPYILHPLRVMFSRKNETERICAVLHDVIEDTDITLDYLRSEGFSEEILIALDALTRRESETYTEECVLNAFDTFGSMEPRINNGYYELIKVINRWKLL